MSIGFTCGTFDLMHTGHVAMFRECKQKCDYLIVGLQTNPNLDRKDKNVPVQSITERSILLNSCKYVDEVIVYETEADLENLLKTLPIDVRFLDVSYFGKDFTGKQLCEDRNIEIHYNSRDHSYSSSELRNRILKNA